MSLNISQLASKLASLLAFSLLIIGLLSSNQLAIAGTEENLTAVEKAQQAAEELVKELEPVKDRFGLSKQDNSIIDKARKKAKNTLESLAEEAQTSDPSLDSLPPEKRLFLQNLEKHP